MRIKQSLDAVLPMQLHRRFLANKLITMQQANPMFGADRSAHAPDNLIYSSFNSRLRQCRAIIRIMPAEHAEM